MQTQSMFFLFLALAALAWPSATAQDVTVTADVDAAEGLDLKALAELFRTTGDAAFFERALNDPSRRVNNLDLDDDGEVDYLRVTGYQDGTTHVLVVQAALGEDSYQDVATIEVDKRHDTYEVQVTGNEQVYGPDYHIHPTGIDWAGVAFIAWLYRPAYRPYVSPFRYRVYPDWYRPWRPLAPTVYRSRVVKVYAVPHVRYEVVKVTRIPHVRRIYARPSVSVLVKKPLRRPTTAQKQYQTRTKTKTVAHGGFGKTKETTVTKTKTTGANGHKEKTTVTKTKTKTKRGGKTKVTKTKTRTTKTKKKKH